jgi:serine palmitoyltransferase
MSVPAAQQIISSMRIIMGEDEPEEGKNRLESLRNNSNYFRTRLKELGYQVFGDEDSPIVPMMIYNLSKVAAFSRLCLENNVSIVSPIPSFPSLHSRFPSSAFRFAMLGPPILTVVCLLFRLPSWW